MINEEKSKLKWCLPIVEYLIEFDWPVEEGWDLATSLHYFCVIEDGDTDADPLECLKEEMTCWGE